MQKSHLARSSGCGATSGTNIRNIISTPTSTLPSPDKIEKFQNYYPQAQYQLNIFLYAKYHLVISSGYGSTRATKICNKIITPTSHPLQSGSNRKFSKLLPPKHKFNQSSRHLQNINLFCSLV